MKTNTFDLRVETAIGTTYEIKECTSLTSNLHGLLVFSERGSYQIGSECKVAVIAMR